jgi:hypothetical protein
MKPGVVVAVVLFFVLFITGTILGVYFTNVACPSFGSDCKTDSPAPSPITTPGGAPGPSPSPGPAPEPRTPTPLLTGGAPSTPPTQAQVAADVLTAIGIGLAINALLTPGASLDALAAVVEKLKAGRAFTARLASRITTRLTKTVTTINVRSRIGRMGFRAMNAAGTRFSKSAANAARNATAEVNAADSAARAVNSQAADRAASQAAGRSVGAGLATSFDALAISGLIVDAGRSGVGTGELTTTSRWKELAVNHENSLRTAYDADVANDPDAAAYPPIIGPFDGLDKDILNATIMSQYFAIISNPPPNTPVFTVVRNLLQKLQTGATNNNGSLRVDDIYLIAIQGVNGYLTEAEAAVLDDAAFSAACTQAGGGVIVQNGVPRCSHGTSATCLAATTSDLPGAVLPSSPASQSGINMPSLSVNAPGSSSSGTDALYTEWRPKIWFDQFSGVTAPAAGGCIGFDPALKDECEKPINPGAVKDKYDRLTGLCVNTQSMCNIKQASFHAAEVDPPANIGGPKLDTCVVNPGLNFCKDYLFGDSICTTFPNVGDGQATNAGTQSQVGDALLYQLNGGSGWRPSDSDCNIYPEWIRNGRTKMLDAGGGKWICCKPGQTVLNGRCVDQCRTDQTRDVSGACVCGGSKPVNFGDRCGTVAECPACTGGKVQKGQTSCLCECPSGQYDDNGTCRNQGTCPPGKMYTGTGRPMSASDCVTACSGATPVWNPDTQTCVAVTGCPGSKPYVNPPTDRISGTGITGIQFCGASCEGGLINGMVAMADETTRTCVASCPSGTTVDFLNHKCVGQGACPQDRPWYDINGASCLTDTEIGLLGEAKYQSVGGNPGKLGVCPQGKKKNTGTTGGLCVPIAAGEKDQMTDVIGNYGWNVLGFGNDTAAAAYCSANGGAIMTPKTCSTCGSGQYVDPSTGQCTGCPVNTYKSGNGWRLSDCLACPSGTGTNGATGQTSTSGCTLPPCPQGQVRASDGVSCYTPITSCPAGQQKNATGNFCEACPSGTYKSDTSLNACSTCGPGSKVTNNSTACTPIYTKYTNTNVPNFDNYNLSIVPFSQANGRSAYATGTLTDAYNACDNLPGCAGFSRSNQVYSLSTPKTIGNDSTRNYTVLLTSGTASGTRTTDANYDFYKKN